MLVAIAYPVDLVEHRTDPTKTFRLIVLCKHLRALDALAWI